MVRAIDTVRFQPPIKYPVTKYPTRKKSDLKIASGDTKIVSHVMPTDVNLNLPHPVIQLLDLMYFKWEQLDSD